MLEPWTPELLAPSRLRALAVRHGFDLEPLLPDPAPAWIDPEEAFHPALTESVAALPLHRYPTPGARAALCARIVSEPGRPDLDADGDPFVALYRFAAREAMEPEVTGCFALVLLRARLDDARRTWRPALPDPVAALHDPAIDVFRHRRARLVDTEWDVLWDEVHAAADFLGDDDALAFERVTLRAAVEWLGDYRAWWDVARHLGDGEDLRALAPDALAALDAALDAFALRLASPGDDSGARPPASSATALASAIAGGAAAEAAFLAEVGRAPDGPVSARWLLAEQVRALRDLRTATRERSLRLHELLRRADVARVRVQLAYRAALLQLWRAPDDEAAAALEDALLGVADPPHATTLGAGLGRVLGVVLLRRLRRGDDRDALPLAERALRLAPEELAVRLTWNDLRYARGGHDAVLLASIRAEVDRWDSVSARVMGARVAGALGDRSTARHLGNDLAARGLAAGTGSGWAVAVTWTLRSPAGRTDRARLDALAAAQQPPPDPPDPLARILFGDDDVTEAWGDLELALASALDELDQAAALETAAVPASGGKKGPPKWRQLTDKKLVATDHPEFAGRLFARLQGLRAAAPELRRPLIAQQLRLLSAQLAEAAELTVAVPAELADVLPRLGAWLQQPSEPGETALADFLGAVCYPLRSALRAPRVDALIEQLSRLRAELRVLGRAAPQARADQLRARLADPDVDLAEAAEALAELAAELDAPDPDRSPADASAAPPAGQMRFHPDFDAFSRAELGILPEALVRARRLVRLFNLSGGKRDRKRLKAGGGALFELRARTSAHGGLRVFYRRSGDGWEALAAMSKYDDRQQRDAIARVLGEFGDG